MDFQAFPKIPSLAREIIVTEKLDGTNAQIFIQPAETAADGIGTLAVLFGLPYLVRAGSRSRWITPEDDNYGFARWVHGNANELVRLGEGSHFGEWWGAGIQRGYGVSNKRFNLFNTERWSDPAVRPACAGIVPVLYQGPFSEPAIEFALHQLAVGGSSAAPGYMDPEGVVVYHTAANALFKKTCKHDDEPKLAHVAKPKPPRPPRDKSKGGQRVADLPYSGLDRRRPQEYPGAAVYLKRLYRQLFPQQRTEPRDR